MADHTEGPWIVTTSETADYSIMAHVVPQGAPGEMRAIAEVFDSPGNAALIGAAPDQHNALLDLLAWIERVYGTSFEEPPEFKAARAAIAKAQNIP